MQEITYSRFAESLRIFFNNRSTGENLIFSLVLLAAIIIFIIWFGFYLRKTYLHRRKTVDTFDTFDASKEKIDYPGFHMGEFRDEVPKSKKEDKPDKWGKIDDD